MLNRFLNFITFTLLLFVVANVAQSSDFASGNFANDFISRIAYYTTSETREFKSKSINEMVPLAQEAVVSIEVFIDAPVYSYRLRSQSRFDDFEPSTVTQKIATGSGFFITQDGYILTNKHVVFDESAEYMVNISSTLQIPAKVVYRDPLQDLAVIKVEGSNYPVIELGDSSELKVGENIIGIGNAFGQMTDSVSTGTVSALNRSIMVAGVDDNYERMRGLIETNADIYPGDSGGPLLNLSGEAVGVNVASAVGESVGFSIPINVAKSVIKRAGVYQS